MLIRSAYHIVFWSCLIPFYAHSSIVVVSGFARLLEEETFLSRAEIIVDEFDWNGNPQEAPKKRCSRTITTNAEGDFHTTVQKGGWFRLSLKQGVPSNLDKAMADWLQHAVPSISNFSSEALTIIRLLNTESEQLLHYIAMDSGLMPADKDYLGRDREMTFQVPLVITRSILNQLSLSTYGIGIDATACQLVVTALSPRFSSTHKHLYTCPNHAYAPLVQNLFDCPHGASGVTFSTFPQSQGVHYFGINEKCKTDILASGLTATTRDGGGLLGNIYPEEPGKVAVLFSKQHGTDLPLKYFLCEPGRMINISPPHGPAGLVVENGFVETEVPLTFYTGVGILYFSLELAGKIFNGSAKDRVKNIEDWVRIKDEL